MKKRAVVTGVPFKEPTLIPLCQVDPEEIPQDQHQKNIMSQATAVKRYQIDVRGAYGPDQGGEWFNPDSAWRVVIRYVDPDINNNHDTINEPEKNVHTSFHAYLRRDKDGNLYGAIFLGSQLVYLTHTD